MSAFVYQQGQLMAEQVALASIAEQFSTPCYVYSRQAIEQSYLGYRQALDSRGANQHLICYSVKANSNLAVLSVLAKLGSGFDIVSGGELERVIRAGGDPAKVVFSGVAKNAAEISRALEAGVHCFNVESETELLRINRIAADNHQIASVSLRVNPDVDAQTHPYISTGLKENKFGIDIDEALSVYRHANRLSAIRIIGIDCHIGSQRVLSFVDTLAEEVIELAHIYVGGGLGICYQDEQPPSAADYVASLLDTLGERSQTLIMEPGRSIVANAGVLLTTVDTIKSNEQKNFAIVDAAMNDLLRPALYQAWMNILPVNENADCSAQHYAVVGPVCETGDFLGKERLLAIAENDVLAVCSAGAYGFVMASNYNSRGRPAEVMVDGEQLHLVRERETIEDLMRGEISL